MILEIDQQRSHRIAEVGGAARGIVSGCTGAAGTTAERRRLRSLERAPAELAGGTPLLERDPAAAVPAEVQTGSPLPHRHAADSACAGEKQFADRGAQFADATMKRLDSLAGKSPAFRHKNRQGAVDGREHRNRLR